MAYSPVTWAYRDATTVQKMTQMENNNVWTSERGIFGCQIDVSAGNTCIVAQGKMELGGMWLYRNSAITSLNASATGDWEENTTVALLSSTSFYVVAYNDADNSFNVKFRASGPAYSDTSSATSVFPRLYDKTGSTWFRYIGICYTNTASALINCQRLEG